jgi:hypothetical protein
LLSEDGLLAEVGFIAEPLEDGVPQVTDGQNAFSIKTVHLTKYSELVDELTKKVEHIWAENQRKRNGMINLRGTSRNRYKGR